MSKNTYQIRKTIVEKNISTLMNDSLGVVLEFNNFDEVSKICEIMNSNSDSNCKYEIVVITNRKKNG
jgi:ppGpp synthetase/RelA/SpoT-type nucleotidyltranferase|tara:strand:+ start:3250 stop:3450 length:201 start_codon:yes stop_codon:yes gene_type:complete